MPPTLLYIVLLLLDLFALTVCLCICAVIESGNSI